ncbi:Alpha/Beta hydrolase protein [Coprinopsis sp. MPI-PUGE-AT-0042]|nr:Alpha/Beta hydrolase protein [Coprinopsis sp. MPI-PUGE-AT-0042]
MPSLHPSVIDRLDPEFVEFHRKALADFEYPIDIPWDPVFRQGGPFPGEPEPLPVGKIGDFDAASHLKVRGYTPPGEAPATGWPTVLFIHGGGFVFGNLDSEKPLYTRLCIGARCVVIAVDYRLAPEHVYPAAVDDVVTALEWTVGDGKSALNLDISKLVIAGASAGANLAAVLAIKATLLPQPISVLFQILIAPTTDANATVDDYWKENQHDPVLYAAAMDWMVSMYHPNKEDWNNWDVSPLLTPPDLLKNVAPAWLALGEVDLLREEGLAYGKKLKQSGVPVDIEIYKGVPHGFMGMEGVLKISRKFVDDTIAVLNKAFGN